MDWELFPVSEEWAEVQAQLAGHCEAQLTLSVAPGCTVLALRVPSHPIAVRLARGGKEGRMSRSWNLPTGSFTRELAGLKYQRLGPAGPLSWSPDSDT